MIAMPTISSATTRRRACAVLVIAAVTSITSSCGATTYDESIATTSVFTAPTSTTVPTGTTQELLGNLAVAMNGLSGLIGPDSSGRTPAGKNERIVTIEALWKAVQPTVASSDADAADAIGRMVELAKTAVERNRPADADKAARFAGQVIDKFLSEI
jgi:hypothetical protein